MSQAIKAQEFRELHRKGHPIVLYNVWDAGGAKTIASGGAKAIATGSWSVAAAQGFEDGEQIPLDLVLTIVSRIAASIDLPLTVDFEGGYSEKPELISANVGRLIKAGAVGLNFEDRRVGREGLHETAFQQERIRAIRQTGDDAEIGLFINARTDLFLKEPVRENHAALLGDAKERAIAYGEAGADGFFAPGLVNPDLIAELCEHVTLPVNIMMMEGAPSIDTLASCGVGRISHGPGPYFAAMARLEQSYRDVFAEG